MLYIEPKSNDAAFHFSVEEYIVRDNPRHLRRHSHNPLRLRRHPLPSGRGLGARRGLKKAYSNRTGTNKFNYDATFCASDLYYM